MIRLLCLSTFLVLVISSIHGQNSLTLQQMQEDFDQLANAYKNSHQGLYFYTSQAEANQKIDSLRATLSTELDQRTFFNKIAALVALSNEGHTNLGYSSKDRKKLKKLVGFVPLGIFFCGENQDAIIKSIYRPDLQDLKGKKVLSINGYSIKQFMKTTLPYVATDGFNITSAYEWVAWDFPFFFYQAYGPASIFEIELEDLAGNKTIRSINALDYGSIKKQSGASDFLLLNGIFESKAFRIMEDSIAYVSLYSFSGKPKVFKEFYKEIFTTIKEKNIQHLIIDIQRHVGGSEGIENLLASYLMEEPFQKYKEVSAPASAYEKFKNKKSYLLDQWSLSNGIPVRGDYTLMSNYYSEFDFEEPPLDLIYKGKIYVLTSGVTFSGGAEFASMLKMRNRAVFIGEEVGGAHEGNVSGTGTQIRLKHSKISASLPYIHFKMDVENEAKGHGVLPDYFVPQSWKDLNNETNSKLEFTKELIQGIQ